MTAFGDLLFWEQGWAKLLNTRHNILDYVAEAQDIDLLFDVFLSDPSYLREELNHDLFMEAKGRLGVPPVGHCYAFEPLLVLGGNEHVNQLSIYEAKMYLDMVAQASGTPRYKRRS